MKEGYNIIFHFFSKSSLTKYSLNSKFHNMFNKKPPTDSPRGKQLRIIKSQGSYRTGHSTFIRVYKKNLRLPDILNGGKR